MPPVLSYYRSIAATHESGDATEHSYRPALVELLQALGEDDELEVINEPSQSEFGAPDIVLKRQGIPIGYIECKDLHIDLNAAAESEQLRRYRQACDNLILTNYWEFRWYRGGEWQDKEFIAAREKGRLRNIYHRNTILRSFLERFLRAAPQDIRSPEELAQVMATLTREIATQIRDILDEPGKPSFLRQHKQGLERHLLPRLANAEFADMYAQTLAYALFAARMEFRPGPQTPAFTLQWAFFNLPRTNPFLLEEFQEIFRRLEPEVSWAAEQLATRLAHTDIDEVMRDFRRGTEQRDAIVHFYEDFLATHDPILREQRGVYFTPAPIVGYITRSVDAILRSRFGRRDGLADGGVHILDPATGTGSFLLEVMRQIYESQAGQRGSWPGYVRQNLLPRLYGFELLMAPYTLAHMRLGLYLQETQAPLAEGDRLQILLTNALERGELKSEYLFGDYITEEANAAAAVKNEKPIMVVLGNPPYSGHSANKGDWIRDLLRDYYTLDGKPLDEKNPKWLQDDYVKFLRFGQWRINENKEGVVAMITNHSYLDNPTFAGMRQQLLNTYSEIYLLDLHGNSKKKEKTPEGNKDENVFDIQQGVAIAFFVKKRGKKGPARVFHADIWGLRQDKYDWLSEFNWHETQWEEIEPQSPSYWFTPFDYEGWSEFAQGWKITDIFNLNSTGIVTSRDKFVLDFEPEPLLQRIADFRDKRISDDEIRHRYNLRDKKHWKLARARAAIMLEANWQSFLQPCLYRPFDSRFLYNHSAILEGARTNIMRHMLTNQFDSSEEIWYGSGQTGKLANWQTGRRTAEGGRRNLALVSSRNIEQKRTWDQILCTDTIICLHGLSIKEVNYIFPLYLYHRGTTSDW